MQLFFLEEVSLEYVSRHTCYSQLQTLSTKHRSKSVVSTGGDIDGCEELAMANMPLRSLLTRSVVITIANLTMLAFLGISLMALLPLFLSTPIDLGGVGFTPSSIGSCLALFGIVNGVFQALCFANIVNWLGPKRVFCLSVLCLAPVMVTFPVISWLARARGVVDHAVMFVLLSQLVLTIIWDMAYGAYYHVTTLPANPLIIHRRDYLPVCHSLCPRKGRPRRYLWSWSNHLGNSSCCRARLSDFALCIVKAIQSSEWKCSICRLHYTCWCNEVAGITVTRRITREG
jgi:hypothetical protein